MAEFINPNEQNVEATANILFTDTVVEPCCKVRHRKGSGIFTLKGGSYIVSFNANVTTPTGATVAPITFAIALNGEAVQGGIMTTTPSAVGAYESISCMVYVIVPCNCCYTLSVKNTGVDVATVDDANIVTIREAQ